MTKEAVKTRLENPELTITEMYKTHCQLYDEGFRLPLIHDLYLYAVEKDENEELKAYREIFKYRNSLQEGGFSGHIWLCPEYKILDKNIFSVEAEDYLEYLTGINP